jgi:hypothetical protein
VRRLGKSFKSISELNAYLQQKINETLLTDVSEVVKDELESSVSDEVYGAGEPKQYIRRDLKNGSLGDKNTMNSELISSGLLEVSPDADFNHPFASTHGGYGAVDLDKSLTENIEYGYGSKTHWYDIPRPFIQESRDNLKQSQAHVECMKDGLRARGLDVV